MCDAMVCTCYLVWLCVFICNTVFDGVCVTVCYYNRQCVPTYESSSVA